MILLCDYSISCVSRYVLEVGFNTIWNLYHNELYLIQKQKFRFWQICSPHDHYSVLHILGNFWLPNNRQSLRTSVGPILQLSFCGGWDGKLNLSIHTRGGCFVDVNNENKNKQKYMNRKTWFFSCLLTVFLWWPCDIQTGVKIIGILIPWHRLLPLTYYLLTVLWRRNRHRHAWCRIHLRNQIQIRSILVLHYICM